MQWEYKRKGIMVNQDQIDETLLETMGNKGWELVCIAPNGHAIFKRPKEEISEDKPLHENWRIVEERILDAFQKLKPKEQPKEEKPCKCNCPMVGTFTTEEVRCSQHEPKECMCGKWSAACPKHDA